MDQVDVTLARQRTLVVLKRDMVLAFLLVCGFWSY